MKAEALVLKLRTFGSITPKPVVYPSSRHTCSRCALVFSRHFQASATPKALARHEFAFMWLIRPSCSMVRQAMPRKARRYTAQRVMRRVATAAKTSQSRIDQASVMAWLFCRAELSVASRTCCVIRLMSLHRQSRCPRHTVLEKCWNIRASCELGEPELSSRTA